MPLGSGRWNRTISNRFRACYATIAPARDIALEEHPEELVRQPRQHDDRAEDEKALNTTQERCDLVCTFREHGEVFAIFRCFICESFRNLRNVHKYNLWGHRPRQRNVWSKAIDSPCLSFLKRKICFWFLGKRG